MRSSTAATPPTATTSTGPSRGRPRRRLRRLRHERRGVGARSRLLPDDRRAGPSGHRLDPVFASLAPGVAAPAARPAGPACRQAEQGYLHCGPSGAGHFVKMVHNGVEYALMAAYAEGLNIIRSAGVGRHADRGRRRDRAAARAASTTRSTDRPRRGRRGVAPRQRHRLVAARPHRTRRCSTTRPGTVHRPRLRLRRRPMDVHRGDRGGRARRRCSPPRSTADSPRAGASVFADKVQSAQRREFGGHIEKSVE